MKLRSSTEVEYVVKLEKELHAVQEDFIDRGWEIVNLEKENALLRKVKESAKETRDAAAYLMRFIDKYCDPKFIPFLDHKWDGFGKRLDDAITACEAGERGKDA